MLLIDWLVASRHMSLQPTTRPEAFLQDQDAGSSWSYFQHALAVMNCLSGNKKCQATDLI